MCKASPRVPRHFQSGGHRFLETWVPDEDIRRSIMGVIEAAKDDAAAGISIHLGKATLGQVDVAKLKQEAAHLGEVRAEVAEEGLDLNISFLGVDSSHSAPPFVSTFDQQATAVSSGKTSIAPEKPRDSRSVAGNGAANPLYAEGLKRAVESRTHEGTLSPDGSLILIQAAREGVTLSALADTSRNFIRQAAYAGATSERTHGLLETLCRFIETRPIIECYDHAVIFVEHDLRDHSMAPPVPGIVMPESADAMFALPTRLVRDLFCGLLPPDRVR